jgi:hypothetical protein
MIRNAAHWACQNGIDNKRQGGGRQDVGICPGAYHDLREEFEAAMSLVGKGDNALFPEREITANHCILRKRLSSSDRV